ncbi:MAG TPA: PASTA domain-containing protein [Vicinamibacterales bacterium]|jgi:serine/threonine-protein kinase
MALTTRVWSAGKILLLTVALFSTYVLFAALAARIALRVREVKVPALVGVPLESASAIVVELGMTVKVDESRRVDPKIAAGRIAQQDPPAGETARRGRTIKVWLSSGGRIAAVPRVVGESERTAQLRLQQDGLAVTAVSEIRSNEFPPDTIVAQDPPAQTRAVSVSLLVNRSDRAAAYVMPDLIGVNGARGADILRSGGFRVAVVAQHPYPGVPAGVVIRQSPQAGFQVTPGDTVSLEVSR